MATQRITPISPAEFPSISTNCLGFAIGICEPVNKTSYEYDLDGRLSISEAFTKKVTELGFEVPRQIDSVEEAKDNEFVLLVFDFTPHTINYPFVGHVTYYDYHVVRRELDGTWVHKPGWYKPPCKVTNWEELVEEFGRKYVLFAFAA